MAKLAKTKKQKLGSITPDAFLEAVLDCFGDEAEVMLRLEVKDKTLHAFMANHAALVDAAREELSERDVDLTEPKLGWLQLNDTNPQAQTDDWLRYRELLEEEQSLEAHEHLVQARTRTQELVAQLQAAKRNRLKQKSKKVFGVHSDDESENPEEESLEEEKPAKRKFGSYNENEDY